MKKKIKLLIYLFLLNSCQSAQDAFTSDQQVTKESSEGTDIKSLVGNEDKASSSKKEKKTLPTSIEKSILEKIK